MKRTHAYAIALGLSILGGSYLSCATHSSAVSDECPLPSDEAIDRIAELCPEDRAPTPDNVAVCYWLSDLLRSCGW